MSLRTGPILALAAALYAAQGRAQPEKPPEPLSQLDVTVAGTRRPLSSSRDDSISSTRVDRHRLSRPGADASSVLAEVPGAQLSRSGSGAELATVSLRAASSAQTPVYLGRVRLNDDLTGTADLSRVPLWMLDRVEVYRGATPVGLDQWGIGGAVVFEPRRARRSGVNLGGSVGSFGTRSLTLGGAVAGQSASSSVAVRLSRADNDFSYLDDGGTAFDPSDDRERSRDNADHSESDIWSVNQWRLGRARFVTVLNAFSRRQGAAGIALIPASRARSRTRRLVMGTEGRMPCRRDAEACSIELGTDALWTTHAVDDEDRELGLGAASTRLAGVRLGQSAGWRGSLGPVSARVGVRYEVSRLKSESSAVAHARRFTGRSTLGVSYLPVSDLRLLLATALDHHATQGTVGSARSESMPQGRVGAVLSLLPQLSIRGGAGVAQRPPTLGELYGVSAVSLGNPSLEPERGVSAELGVRSRFSPSAKFSFEVDAAGFARQVDDLIAFRRSGFGSLRPFNIGAARVLGAELAARIDALQHLKLDVALTAMEPRDVSEGRSTRNDLLPFQSRLTSFARVAAYTALAPPQVSRAELGLSLRTRSSRVADPAGLIVLPGSRVLSTDAALELFRGMLVLRGALDNILDERELDLLGFPLPGRSVNVSAYLELPLH